MAGAPIANRQAEPMGSIRRLLGATTKTQRELLKRPTLISRDKINQLEDVHL